MARNIPFQPDGVEVTTIRKGNDYRCPRLSAQLKEFDNLFAQRNRSGGKACFQGATPPVRIGSAAVCCYRPRRHGFGP
ncbi:MAG: hypothetical protein P1P84_13175, partial [Deferrisomatales bacterium]|nr:hypothetical protein [Deferrisomatales bacterium]